MEERETIRAFVDFIEEAAQHHPVVLDENFFFPLVSSFGAYDMARLYSDFLKDGSLLSALWVIFLRVYRMSLLNDDDFKYKSLAEFLQAYNGEFDQLDTTEQMKLFYTANWVALCTRMIPAKRNKGFYMHVIPKLIEGYHVKYVTGSGQSKATSDRVRIFEHEGGVKKNSRRKHVLAEMRQQQEYASATFSYEGSRKSSLADLIESADKHGKHYQSSYHDGDNDEGAL